MIASNLFNDNYRLLASDSEREKGGKGRFRDEVWTSPSGELHDDVLAF